MEESTLLMAWAVNERGRPSRGVTQAHIGNSPSVARGDAAEGGATEARYRIQQEIETDPTIDVLVGSLDNLVRDFDIKSFLSLLHRQL